MKNWVLFLVAMMILVSVSMAASAVEILPKGGVYEHRQAPEEPIVTPDPNAVLVGSEKDKLVENGEFEDTGTVWVEWNGHAYSDYGCTTAKINYTNPTRSNIGVTLAIGIFDSDLIDYFGTTFRDVDEQVSLAEKGLEALKSGITLSTATKLVQNNQTFENMDAEELSAMSSEDLIKFLGEKNFIGMTSEELEKLDEASLATLDELQRLELAQLGTYNPYESYQKIAGDTGVINPGYAMYEIDLYTLPGRKVIPAGEYKAVYVLNGYMADKNELSDFFIHLPITLHIAEDLPENVQAEYGVELVNRIDK